MVKTPRAPPSPERTPPVPEHRKAEKVGIYYELTGRPKSADGALAHAWRPFGKVEGARGCCRFMWENVAMMGSYPLDERRKAQGRWIGGLEGIPPRGLPRAQPHFRDGKPTWRPCASSQKERPRRELLSRRPIQTTQIQRALKPINTDNADGRPPSLSIHTRRRRLQLATAATRAAQRDRINIELTSGAASFTVCAGCGSDPGRNRSVAQLSANRHRTSFEPPDPSRLASPAAHGDRSSPTTRRRHGPHLESLQPARSPRRGSGRPSPIPSDAGMPAARVDLAAARYLVEVANAGWRWSDDPDSPIVALEDTPIPS